MVTWWPEGTRDSLAGLGVLETYPALAGYGHCL